MREDGRVERARPRDERERQPSVRARDFEERVGERSAERVAIEDAAPPSARRASWRELHEALAAKGMRFEKKGSGALLWVGDQPVKASAAGRDCSMSALQKRLGEFEPAKDATRAVTRTRALEPIIPGSRLGAVHRGTAPALPGAFKRPREEDTAAAGGVAIYGTRHRRERADIFGGSWKGRGPLLNATRSSLAARQAAEKAEQRERQKRERGGPPKNWGRFPCYEEWLHQDHELAQEWRHRERNPPSIEGPTFERPASHDIRALQRRRWWHVHYRRVGERGSPAFTDRGKEIDIYDSDRRESVLAALQLSAQKWGAFTVRGNEQFQRMCVELAAEHGFKIANPDLQKAVAAERERIHTPGRERPADRDRRTAEIPETHASGDLSASPRRFHPGAPGSADPPVTGRCGDRCPHAPYRPPPGRSRAGDQRGRACSSARRDAGFGCLREPDGDPRVRCARGPAR